MTDSKGTEHYIEQAIALTLHSWPALTLAVQNSWGGSDSADKRDWLAGRIAEQFHEDAETDQEDVEDILLQVMADEFDVNLEDGSEEIVAKDIVRLRKLCLVGDFEEVKALQNKWQERQRRGADAATRNLQIIEQKAEGESSSSDEEEDEDEDVEMVDGSQTSAATPKEKPAPEVDEDGFTKVVSKKKR